MSHHPKILLEAQGGTSEKTYVKGDILHASANDVLDRLAIGSAGYVLTVVSGDAAWAAAASAVVAYTEPASYPYTVLTTDYLIGVETAAARTILLPNAPAANSMWVIKDRVGTANVYNITLTTVGGAVYIDEATSLSIKSAWASVTVFFNGTKYLVI
jgi:hypothetical protein